MSGFQACVARCDKTDRLIEADGPLAGLQARCGGEVDGVIAIPALLTLVRRARLTGLRLRATIGAVDEAQAVSLDVAVAPEAEGGTRIDVLGWRRAHEPLAQLGSTEAVLRQIAAAQILLDEHQAVLAVSVRDPELDAFGQDLGRARGRLWTDFVTLDASNHRQPLHWRLLDDSRFTIPPATRPWRARFFPRVGGGFDLLIVPELTDAAIQPMAQQAPAAAPSQPWNSLLGRDLAPALRKPVNRIIANAETIRTRLAGPLASEYADYAGDIAEAGRHLLGLIEDLADLEAVEAPGFAPAPDHIDLGDCARRAAGILSVRAQERGIRLVTPEDNVHVPAIGEFRRVLQILLNLLTNAIRYTPENAVITLATGRDGAQAWIAVSDEGQGLGEEQAARVFDKFERLGRSGDGGSGLGLYISRRLARAMGGDLHVIPAGTRSRTGSGACFVLTLPAGG